MAKNLEKLALLEGLSTGQIGRISSISSEKTFLSGEVIIWQGDFCEAIYCVLSGAVEIYRLSAGGREQTLDRMHEGQWFNLVPALITDENNQANARALSECRLLIIQKPDFLRLLAEIPEFSLAVNKYFAKRLAHMTDLVETLSLYSVRQRLAKFLINQADAGGRKGAVHWTQSEMAYRLGTVREVLGRSLRKMVDEGALRIEREKIMLLDRDKLDQIAKGDE